MPRTPRRSDQLDFFAHCGFYLPTTPCPAKPGRRRLRRSFCRAPARKQLDFFDDLGLKLRPRRRRRLLKVLQPDPPSILGQHERPRLRGQCEEGIRPCPWVSCRYHLAMETRVSSVKFPFGEEISGLSRHTCALDVADEGEHSRVEVAALMGSSRSRIADIETLALQKMEQSYRETMPPGATLDALLAHLCRLREEED